MAVYRKWDVVLTDDRGERHCADYETKAHALAFCKAMQRMGANSVVGVKNGLIATEFFRFSK